VRLKKNQTNLSPEFHCEKYTLNCQAMVDKIAAVVRNYGHYSAEFLNLILLSHNPV